MPNCDQLIDIFNEAKARPAGPQRDQLVIEACGTDGDLKEQVSSLLQAEAAAGEFLQLQCVTPIVTEKPGDMIGPYKLRELLGEGGCGVVYVADQDSPIRRRV